MWFTPYSTRTGSSSSARSCRIRPRAAEPNTARLLVWPVRPSGALSITSRRYPPTVTGVATTLDWYGCATFALRTAGLTVFLDAYIDRAPNAAGAGRSADDIDECDWIVVGHSHFDHLYGAERIAVRTGARVIGSYETVRVLEQAGV